MRPWHALQCQKYPFKAYYRWSCVIMTPGLPSGCTCHALAVRDHVERVRGIPAAAQPNMAVAFGCGQMHSSCDMKCLWPSSRQTHDGVQTRKKTCASGSRTTLVAACTAAMSAGLSDTRTSRLNQRSTVLKGGAGGGPDSPLRAPAPLPLMTALPQQISTWKPSRAESYNAVLDLESRSKLKV